MFHKQRCAANVLSLFLAAALLLALSACKQSSGTSPTNKPSPSPSASATASPATPTATTTPNPPYIAPYAAKDASGNPMATIDSFALPDDLFKANPSIFDVVSSSQVVLLTAKSYEDGTPPDVHLILYDYRAKTVIKDVQIPSGFENFWETHKTADGNYLITTKNGALLYDKNLNLVRRFNDVIPDNGDSAFAAENTSFSSTLAPSVQNLVADSGGLHVKYMDNWVSNGDWPMPVYSDDCSQVMEVYHDFSFIIKNYVARDDPTQANYDAAKVIKGTVGHIGTFPAEGEDYYWVWKYYQGRANQILAVKMSMSINQFGRFVGYAVYDLTTHKLKTYDVGNIPLTDDYGAFIGDQENKTVYSWINGSQDVDGIIGDGKPTTAISWSYLDLTAHKITNGTFTFAPFSNSKISFLHINDSLLYAVSSDRYYTDVFNMDNQAEACLGCLQSGVSQAIPVLYHDFSDTVTCLYNNPYAICWLQNTTGSNIYYIVKPVKQ